MCPLHGCSQAADSTTWKDSARRERADRAEEFAHLRFLDIARDEHDAARAVSVRHAASSTGGCDRCCTNCTSTGPLQPSTSRKPFTRNRSAPRSAISVSIVRANAFQLYGLPPLNTKLEMPSL